jgi:hypothetical protein
LLIRQIEAHEREAQDPHLQGLRMAGKNGVNEIIKACVAVVTLVALTGGFRVIKATLDDLGGLTRGARDAVWPTQLAYRLITLHIIEQILNVNLHRWTPVGVREMRWHQFTSSSNSTTLESNKSDMVQVIRGYIATAQPQPCLAEEVSAEQIFYDVQRELTAVSVLVPSTMVVAAYAEELSREALCQRLHSLLSPVWTPRWRKAVNAKPRPKVAKAKLSGAHTSKHRLLGRASQERCSETAAA